MNHQYNHRLTTTVRLVLLVFYEGIMAWIYLRVYIQLKHAEPVFASEEVIAKPSP